MSSYSSGRAWTVAGGQAASATPASPSTASPASIGGLISTHRSAPAVTGATTCATTAAACGRVSHSRGASERRTCSDLTASSVQIAAQERSNPPGRSARGQQHPRPAAHTLLLQAPLWPLLRKPRLGWKMRRLELDELRGFDHLTHRARGSLLGERTC